MKVTVNVAKRRTPANADREKFAPAPPFLREKSAQPIGGQRANQLPHLSSQAMCPSNEPLTVQERVNTALLRKWMEIAYPAGKAVAHLCVPGNQLIAPATFSTAHP